MYYGRNYFSSKNFKSVKNDETVIVGDTAKHIWDARKHKNIAKLKYEDSIMCVKPKIFGKTVGYIEVGENEYIRVKKHGSTLMIALLLLLSSIFLIGGNVFKDDVKPIIGVGQDIEDYPGSSKGNVEYINVPGLRAEYLLTESNKDVYLVNPEGNSVYFKYTLYNNDEVIFTRDTHFEDYL